MQVVGIVAEYNPFPHGGTPIRSPAPGRSYEDAPCGGG